ncbi:MAG TPA: zinc ABC transporter substrate-binding protein [Deltaproteobacteria bacterium]|nr:zinc ABC transporter substrate-binding protein [Deltaproteobacteria bacterium]HQB37854.1 zinc ABC transporter substrate-binding protein [Deltaproteobacteria bacterium]
MMAVVFAALTMTGCGENKHPQNAAAGGMKVVTTLFPLYDFARTIAGNKAEVSLLLPPGLEPHSFEPRPDDLMRIDQAALFVYTNPYMEPWADKIVKGLGSKKLRVVNAGEGVTYLPVAGHDHHHGHDHGRSGEASLDPHIWLDFSHASRMTDNILSAFVAADPANADYYRTNAARLKQRLADLDKAYSNSLSSCASRSFVHGGHYAFGYLAQRYKLDYRALSGVSAESEPSAARMADMVGQIRKTGVRYIFAEELLSPRLTQTMASETGVDVLMLDSGHNPGRDDFKRGVTFIGLMEKNLATLQKGLGCGQ